MNVEVLREFADHIAWADGRMWSAILSDPPAAEDARIVELMIHVHLVQRAFVDVWEGREVRLLGADDFDGPVAVCRFGRQCVDDLRSFLRAVDPADLAREIDVPWARYFVPEGRDAPAPTALGEVLLQAAMHSAYHRGQINARIREVGGTPPLVDYIAWLWGGRPDAEWPDLGS